MVSRVGPPARQRPALRLTRLDRKSRFESSQYWRGSGPVGHTGQHRAGDLSAALFFQNPVGVVAVLTTRVDPNSEEARKNSAAMTALVEELRARTAAIQDRGAGGDERSIARHRERGKLPVRERIDKLIDPGSPFLELSPLAANGMYDDEAPGVGADERRARMARRHSILDCR